MFVLFVQHMRNPREDDKRIRENWENWNGNASGAKQPKRKDNDVPLLVQHMIEST